MFTKLRRSHSSQVVDVDRHVDRPVVDLQGTHTDMDAQAHAQKCALPVTGKGKNKNKRKSRKD